MRFETIFMVFLGLSMEYLYLSNDLGTFLHPFFFLFVGIAGFILMVMGGWILIEREQHHTHHHYGFIALVCLVLVAFVLAPSGYSESIVASKGLKTSGVGQKTEINQFEGMFSANQEGYLIAEVAELIDYSIFEKFRSAVDGKSIEVVGQYYEEVKLRPQLTQGDSRMEFESKTEKEFNVIRFYMLCCAADAQTYAIRILPAADTGFENMQWIKVRGEVDFVSQGAGYVPQILNATIEKIDAPNDPFLMN